jgi:hypothetical protein
LCSLQLINVVEVAVMWAKSTTPIDTPETFVNHDIDAGTGASRGGSAL